MLRKFMLTLVLIACVLFMLLVFAAASMAQEVNGTNSTTSTDNSLNDGKPISDVHKYHLQALIAKREAALARLDTLILQFISSNPQAKQLQESASTFGQQQNDVMQEICAEAYVALDKCTADIIDPESGMIKAAK